MSPLPYIVEYAVSNRSNCKGCKKKIVLDDLRLGVMMQAPTADYKYPAWYHFSCFFSTRRRNLPPNTAAIDKFQELKLEDQEKIREQIEKRTARSRNASGTTSSSTKSRKRPLANSNDGNSASTEQDEEPSKKAKITPKKSTLSIARYQLLKTQNGRLHDYREKLNKLKKRDLIDLLKENCQIVPRKKVDKLVRLSDGMTFGALRRCRKCEYGQLKFQSGIGYQCTRQLEWSRCDFESDDPARKLFLIPDRLKREKAAQYNFLKVYRPKIERRMFEKEQRFKKANDKAIYSGLRKDASTGYFEMLRDLSVNDVDPKSRHASTTHVYRDAHGNIYSARLTKTCTQTGRNSFYNIQLLETKSKDVYYIFTSSGRINTFCRQHRDIEYKSLAACLRDFEKKFLQFTGNLWMNRKNFKKKPAKYVMIGIEQSFATDADQVDAPPAEVSSESVRELIKMIFDENYMERVLEMMELDLVQMPLKTIGERDIGQAFGVLRRAEECISEKENGEDCDSELTALSNQFFSLIPHCFGMKNPPRLDNLEIIKQKCEMVDSLTKIQETLLMMSNATDVKGWYETLRTNIRPLDVTTQEFSIIENYVKNTSCHGYNIEIKEIFTVDRDGEDERFTPFKELHNRQLLWHGSGTSNFAGILKQGLRTSCLEAPKAGSTFGPGIYFADRVSKSAHYSGAEQEPPTEFLLLLCEVALGNMQEVYFKKYITTLPENVHSVKAAGANTPNPTSIEVLDDGVQVPLGRNIPSGIDKKFPGQRLLKYNEYIVYKNEQVKIRYLLRLKRC